jgi:hypothetical protein
MYVNITINSKEIQNLISLTKNAIIVNPSTIPAVIPAASTTISAESVTSHLYSLYPN